MDPILEPFWLLQVPHPVDDVLPEKIQLPADVRPGDYLEFGRLGAYSLSGRTDFNGRYSDHIVLIDGEDEYPPGHHELQN